MDSNRRRRVFRKIKKYGGENLLAFYPSLSRAEKTALLEDIDSVDFALMERLYRSAVAAGQGKTCGAPEDAPEDGLSGIRPIVPEDTSKLSGELREKYIAAGLASIGAGELAVVTMAGGQGTRLGHNGPKGTYDIGLDSHRSLFEIHCRRLQRVNAKSGGTVPWFIMTSDLNHEETVEFFRKNAFFGYPEDKICFFRQTMIPAMTPDGRLCLETPSKVLKVPNGNGGTFVSMANGGVIQRLKELGVKYVMIAGVDNCLIKMADPLMLGAFISDQTRPEAAAKSYLKRGPGEKSGIFCERNGHPAVIEYTEVPEKYAALKDGNGEYVYGDCNLLCYIFRTGTVEKLSAGGTDYHLAVKKISFLDPATGEKTERSGCFKFELFLFDAFEKLNSLKVLRVRREDEFAPVKNATGEDSAELARQMYIDYEKRSPADADY